MNVKANDVARAVYRLMGYDVPPSLDLSESKHPQERLCALIGDLVERIADEPEQARDTLYEILEDCGIEDFKVDES